MREVFNFELALKKYRSVENEIIVIQGKRFEIVYSEVWLTDQYIEIPESEANDTNIYKQSLDQVDVRVSVRDDQHAILKTPKLTATNIETNEEERVYKDRRMNINTRNQMMQRLVSKITDSQNTQPTPPPNYAQGPAINEMNPGLPDPRTRRSLRQPFAAHDPTS